MGNGHYSFGKLINLTMCTVPETATNHDATPALLTRGFVGFSKLNLRPTQHTNILETLKLKTFPRLNDTFK